MNVYYNWGRWVVHCPSLDCVGAERVVRGQTATVCQCHDVDLCDHGPLCATPFTVQWPDDPEAIEAATAVRRIANRNWHPHETVTDLRVENQEHGVQI